MKIYVLASGSKGNATVVEHNSHLLQIDMGVSLAYLVNNLAQYNLDAGNIEALLLTHEHNDHIKGIGKGRKTPIFCTIETYNLEGWTTPIDPYQSFEIPPFKITPFAISHDVANPVGYVIEADDEKLVYITDTGYIPERSLNMLKNANYYVFESNHNVKMLLQSNRSAELKLRILSDTGHLSNEDAALYLSSLIGDKTTDIILAHISEECNTPELVMKAINKALKKKGINPKSLRIQCAKQWEPVTTEN